MRKSKKEIKATLVRINTASEDYFDPYINRRKMGSPDVVGEIEEEIQDWTCHNAVFIDSDMGTGKSVSGWFRRS